MGVSRYWSNPVLRWNKRDRKWLYPYESSLNSVYKKSWHWKKFADSGGKYSSFHHCLYLNVASVPPSGYHDIPSQMDTEINFTARSWLRTWISIDWSFWSERNQTKNFIFIRTLFRIQYQDMRNKLGLLILISSSNIKVEYYSGEVLYEWNTSNNSVS